MAKVLVCYYSRTGNTEKMAEKIEEVVKKEGLEVELKKEECLEQSGKKVSIN